MNVPYCVNYRSDFTMRVKSDAGWGVPFDVLFWTGSPKAGYKVGWDGKEWLHCEVDADDASVLVVRFDNHGLGLGDLKYQVCYHYKSEGFPDGEDQWMNAAIVTMNDPAGNAAGTVMPVVLSVDGVKDVEVQFALPAYAAELERRLMEQERQLAEAARQENEAVRKENEAIRQQNEVVRQEAERLRQIAAQNYSHMPYIGTDYYVYQWNVTAGRYENTGVYVKGPQGDRGPKGERGPQGVQGERGPQGERGLQGVQGERGPQGVPGQNGQDGRDGQDGITPHIDETTGDWFVGDEDTGVHAQGPQGVQGERGPQGVPGQNGQDGRDGQGVPTGGTAGQVLKKKSNTDYDTEWGAGGGGASYTPTLDSAPTSSTTTYVKDGETVDFEVGQFARVANGNGWDMYQLYDVTNGVATWEKCENIHADHEDVFIVVTTDVQGVSVSGLVINAYYNGSTAVSASVTTDAQGMASLQVPNGYQYKLVFPDIAGCKSIEPIVHTATVAQRSIEVEYVEQPQLVEAVTVELSQILMDVYTPLSGKTVSVTSGGTTTTYTTDAQGKVQFEIAIGTQYTVTAPQIEDKYIRTGGYTRTYVAERSVRVLNFIYRTYDSGLFVVASDGAEYALNDWETAVAGGTRQNSEAKLIKVATAALIQAGGVFYFDIDDMRNKNYEKKTWESQNILLSSIPQNGNSASSNYYYDGYTASTKIQEECTERGLQCAATSHCLEQQYTGISGATLKGFLGSIGQWQVMWSARIEIDEILQSVRPNGTYLLSGFTDQKWSSTQNSANYAWNWTSAASYNFKNCSDFVVPFFAY